MTALVLVGPRALGGGAMVLVGVVDNFQSNFFFDLAHPLAHLGELQKMLLTHQYRFFQSFDLGTRCSSSSAGPATSPSTPRAAAAAATRPAAAAAAAPCRSPRRSSGRGARVAEHVDEGHRVAESS